LSEDPLPSSHVLTKFIAFLLIFYFDSNYV